MFHMASRTYLFISFTLCLLLATGCGIISPSDQQELTKEEAETQKTEHATNKNESDANTENNFDLSLGEDAIFNGVTITLHSAKFVPGNDYEVPKNDCFIVVHLTANNGSDEDFILSSLLNVSLADNDGHTYTATVLTEGAGEPFDGDVKQGDTLDGDIPFDVIESDTYELHFTDPFQSGEATWVIEKEDIEK